MSLPISYLRDHSTDPVLESARLAGMRRSQKIRQHLARIHAAAVAEAVAVCRLDPRFQIGPDNQVARDFSLISPAGEIFHGRNLSHFIRQNKTMFAWSDVVGRHPSKTRAYGGLIAILRGCAESWKGWRCVS